MYVILKRAASALVSMSTLFEKLLLLVKRSATRRAFVLLKVSTSASTALFASEKTPKTSGVTFSKERSFCSIGPGLPACGLNLSSSFLALEVYSFTVWFSLLRVDSGAAPVVRVPRVEIEEVLNVVDALLRREGV